MFKSKSAKTARFFIRFCMISTPVISNLDLMDSFISDLLIPYFSMLSDPEDKRKVRVCSLIMQQKTQIACKCSPSRPRLYGAFPHHIAIDPDHMVPSLVIQHKTQITWCPSSSLSRRSRSHGALSSSLQSFSIGHRSHDTLPCHVAEDPDHIVPSLITQQKTQITSGLSLIIQQKTQITWYPPLSFSRRPRPYGALPHQKAKDPDRMVPSLIIQQKTQIVWCPPSSCSRRPRSHSSLPRHVAEDPDHMSALLPHAAEDFHKCVMVYKCRNSLAPSYLEKLFTSNDTKHIYKTRHSSVKIYQNQNNILP